MSTFGAWLAHQVHSPDRVGNLARHVMQRDNCDECQHKEDGEEVTWDVAAVVRDLDAHRAGVDAYDELEEAIMAWAASRRFASR